MKSSFSRRQFLRSAGVAAGLAASVPLLEACAQVAPTPVIIEKEKPVTVVAEKVVTVEKEVTKIVEKPVQVVVTATPAPVPTPVNLLVRYRAFKGAPIAKLEKPVKLEVGGWGPEGSKRVKGFQAASKIFVEEHPGVDLIFNVSSPALSTALKLREMEGDPPEIGGNIFADPVRNTLNFAAYWKGGHIYDLTEMYDSPAYDDKTKKVKDYINPIAMERIKWEDRYTTFLNSLQLVRLMIYDVEFWKQNDIAVPKTYTEFLDACERWKKKGIPPIVNMMYYPTWYMDMFWDRYVGTSEPVS